MTNLLTDQRNLIDTYSTGSPYNCGVYKHKEIEQMSILNSGWKMEIIISEEQIKITTQYIQIYGIQHKEC